VVDTAAYEILVVVAVVLATDLLLVAKEFVEQMLTLLVAE